jgi:hypothetical protein
MEGIPPARASDNEDVIWALETAESLWKRNARVDAIVWLRRAAQEAAEAGDDDRASTLMVEAASLTESLARSSAHTRAAQPITSPPPSGAVEAARAAAAADDLDALLGTEIEIRGEDAEAPVTSARESLVVDSADVIEIREGEPVGLSRPTPVPTGEPSMEELPPTSEEGATAHGASEEPAAEEVSVDDDVIILDDEEILDAPAEATDGEVAAAPAGVPAGEAFGEVKGFGEAADLPGEGVEADVAEAAAAPADEAIEGVTFMGDGALSLLDLAASPALAAAGPEQQERLVQGARVILCVDGVVVPEFGLALVLEGEVAIHAHPGGHLLGRASAGRALRARSSLDVSVHTHARFTVTADDTTLALWSEGGLEAALAGGASVDEELRRDGDLWLGWAGLAESQAAARLPEDVRLRLVDRMKPRVVAPGAVLLSAGEPVGGMLLVGWGSVALDRPGAAPLSLGEFVFADATLSNGKASATAHAGPEGAIVMFADRRTTQELYATEPLLLELLSSSC